MTKTKNFASYVALLFSVIALSACATKPKEAPVAEPAPVAKVAEKAATPEPAPAPVPVVAEKTATAPVVMAEQPVPMPVVKKAKKKAAKAKAAAKVAEPIPVAAPAVAPAPVVKQEAAAAAPPEPVPAPEIAEPDHKDAAPGFLEKYWLWLLGVVIAVGAFLWIKNKK